MGITIAHDSCHVRKCKHFKGIVMGREWCIAFPDGIPDEIAFGNNPHTEPLPEQGNNIVFEKECVYAGNAELL